MTLFMVPRCSKDESNASEVGDASSPANRRASGEVTCCTLLHESSFKTLMWQDDTGVCDDVGC